MQRKIIALAVASLVSGAAFAQSNVTIYGIADMSYVNFSDSSQAGYGGGQINSGQWKTSRFGFKGSEDLGNGLSAVFQAEFAVPMDVNNSAITQRPSWVGLKSSSLGEIKAGNFTTFEDDLLTATSVMFGYNTVASPKYVYIETAGGEAQNVIGNAVHYYSPVWNGFQIKAGGSTHSTKSGSSGTGGDDVANPTGTTGTTGNNQVLAVAAMYNNGPFVAGATYEYNKYDDYSGASHLDSGNTWNVAASYDFGFARIGGAYGTINYAQNPGVTRDDRKQWHIGVSAPITPNDVIALNYAHATTGYNNAWSDDSIGFWGIGYMHSLSKRTTLYAAYGDINQSNSDHTRASLDRTAFIGPNSAANYTFEQAVAVGIRHDF